MRQSVLGLDIGGANLKAAHTKGYASQRAFALWKQPERLAAELRQVIAGAPKFDRLVVTMTGELCDCYANKREGVNAILDAVEEVAGKLEVSVWTTDGIFLDIEDGRHEWLKVASANWFAAGVFAGRFVPLEPTLLID